MAASDALIVGEDWISEHYFTTDAKSESFQAKVIERRKAWDEDAKNGASTVRSRFIAARGRLGTSIADLLAGQPGTATTACRSCTPNCAGPWLRQRRVPAEAAWGQSSGSARPTWPRARR